mmetsp:Transcript_7925/g.14921  ORF Transcript_7925/g.14921 Transcript_7925/m.14921 type:complete len:222 (+) Transcript_7925:230-895(+)
MFSKEFIPINLESRSNRNGSRNKVSRNKPSNTKHGKTSILEFLKFHFSTTSLVLGVHLHPVNCRLSSSSGRFALKLHTVLVSLDGSTENDKLCPPLRISLSNSSDGIIGRYVSLEMSEPFGENITYGSKHSRTSVGELGCTSTISRDVVTEVKGVKNLSSSFNTGSYHALKVRRNIERSGYFPYTCRYKCRSRVCDETKESSCFHDDEDSKRGFQTKLLGI